MHESRGPETAAAPRVTATGAGGRHSPAGRDCLTLLGGRIRLTAADIYVLYVLIAVAVCWPVPADIAGILPVGVATETTVPYAMTWALWWTADRLAHGLADFWNAPIFFPAPGTFTYGEPMVPLGVLTAPIFLFGGAPALAHNLALLLSLFLNGVSAFTLLRAARLRFAAAAAGGAIAMALPYTQDQMGVLTLVPLFAVNWTLQGLLVFTRRPTLRRGLLVGLGFAAIYGLCGQYGLFFAMAAPAATLCLARREHFRVRPLLFLFLGIALAGLLLFPQLAAQRNTLETRRFEKSLKYVYNMTRPVYFWTRSQAEPLVPFPGTGEVERKTVRTMYPGALKIALALLAVCAGLATPRLRRLTGFFLVFGATAFLLAILPRIAIGGWSPFEWLYQHVPGIAQVRSIWRAGVFTQLSLAFLSALLFHQVLERAAGERGALVGRGASSLRRRANAALPLAVFLLAGLALFEVWQPRLDWVPVPAPSIHRPFMEWVAEHVPDDRGLLTLPTEREEVVQWMYLAPLHRRKLAGGYSSNFSAAYLGLIDTMKRDSLGEKTRARLCENQVSHLSIRRAWRKAAGWGEPDPTHYPKLHEYPTVGLDIYAVSCQDRRRES